MRNWLYGLLVLVLILTLVNTTDEAVYFQFLTLLIVLILLFIVDMIFFQSQRAFIFDPFYANYQKLTKPMDY